MNTDRILVSPEGEPSLAVAEIGELHRKRGEAWVRRQVETYLSFYWDDAILYIIDEHMTLVRMTADEMRRDFVELLEAGGGPLTIELPPVDDIAISSGGDAATTSFKWRASYRTTEGIDTDRSYYETDVWYRRNGSWKIIRMHLTRLSLSPVSTS